jgi:endo-1,4-beta-xylanase
MKSSVRLSFTLHAILLAFCICAMARAQSTTPSTQPVAMDAVAMVPPAIPLWPGGAPGSEGQTAPEKVIIREEPGISFPVVTNIHKPSITAFLPDKDIASGAAVIIAPGGGHQFLSIDHEGYGVARYLAEHGVAGFVLKYRLARAQGSPYKVDVHALMDAQRAIRLIRSRADEWGIDSHRVGILGFSAGGEVAVLAATRFGDPVKGSFDVVDQLDCRPDFFSLIYPGLPGDGVKISKDVPEAFLACAYDDRPTMSTGLATLFINLKAAGVPAELHVYNSGGHGFGIRPGPLAAAGWPARFVEWMKDRGLLKTR